MAEESNKWFFCNSCKQKTKHHVRGKHDNPKDIWDGVVWYRQRMLIIECCGCEHLEFVEMSRLAEGYGYFDNEETAVQNEERKWNETIYPPVTYRNPPPWFEDLPDPTLRAISKEIYNSLQTNSHYLATFGSRTLIDRLIVLTVGDKDNFSSGLQALEDEGKLSAHEREILNPVIDAGNAAAHRGWTPTKEQITVILDTVEGLIHRLLVLPGLADELDDSVPSRVQGLKVKIKKPIFTIRDKIDAAPKDLRAVYDELAKKLWGLGADVAFHPQKHYMAFRRNRNFASVRIYNQKRVIRIYLNLDPDTVELDSAMMRDVRQVGHYGTGDLEITIKTKRDIEKISELLEASYDIS
jgi:predicted transport protein